MAIKYGEHKGGNALVFLAIAIIVSNIMYTGAGKSSSENQQEPNEDGSNGNINKEEEKNGSGYQSQNGSESGNGSSGGEKDQTPNGNQGGESNPPDNGSHYSWENIKENDPHYGYGAEIWQGVENGTVIMKTSLINNGGQLVKENYHYHSGMWLDLEQFKDNKVSVRVSAEYKERKVIVINIDANVLAFNKLDEIRVTFDGEPIEMGDSEELFETKGDKPKYVAALDTEDTQFLVYIPYFSEHTIEIESLVEPAEEKFFSSANYMVMGLSILILIGLSIYIYKIGKWRA